MQYCRKYCLLSWKCIVCLFVFLLSQILNKEKINRNLQDFQSVTKIPHNKKNTLKTIICGLEYVRLHSKSCASSRQPPCFQRCSFYFGGKRSRFQFVALFSQCHYYCPASSVCRQVIIFHANCRQLRKSGTSQTNRKVFAAAHFSLAT